jgi:signal transduction histidine kinase
VTFALRRPALDDALLTVALLTLGQLTTWLRLDSADAFAGSRWANAVVLAVGTTPLLWRRFLPTAAVAVSTAVLCLPHALVELDVTVLGQFMPLLVVTASCGYYASPRRALVGASLALTGMLVVSASTPFLRTPTSFVFNLLVLLAPWAAARGLRHREDRARRLGAALEHESAHFEGRMAHAVEQERAAIARDLHDVVAHGVSVMVVQIGGARMQLTENHDVAARSLLQAEDAGRQALADLRRMLGVLRSSDAPEPQPRPGLRYLHGLVERTANAGLHITTCITGNVHTLPAAVDISAYRIVQEALTNALKHGHADHASLRIDVSDRLLSITVHDGGPLRRASDQPGLGLVGIRERVAFLGGQARIGPDGSGGWEVTVTIPLAVARDATPAAEGAPR